MSLGVKLKLCAVGRPISCTFCFVGGALTEAANVVAST